MNVMKLMARSKSTSDLSGLNQVSSVGMAAATVLQKAWLKPPMAKTVATSTTKSRARGGGTKRGIGAKSSASRSAARSTALSSLRASIRALQDAQVAVCRQYSAASRGGSAPSAYIE